MWVVTAEFNEYDQHGEYFIAVYLEKPTFAQLKYLLPEESDVVVGKLTRGGGRQDIEEYWYHLREVQEGEFYKGEF